MKKIEVPIILAFTPNYFVPAATCILSILKNSKESDKFEVIVLLSEALPDSMKKKLRRLGDGRINFVFFNLEGRLNDIYVNDKYTVAASYRLLLPGLLPDHDRVIYVDCDVIVRNNLASLFHSIDLKDNYMAGVFEATLDFQESHLRELGCNPGEYINSGFLVMNLAQLREDKMVDKFVEASKAEYLEFPDQDVINQLCKGRIIGLSPVYNSIRTFFLPQYKSDFLKYYSEEDWNAVQEHGTIHYTGAKPWNAFTVEFLTWWQYYMELPKEIKDEGGINTKMFLFYRIYNTNIGYWLISQIQNMYRKYK